MFDSDMYKQLLEVVHLTVQATILIDNVEADSVSLLSYEI